LERSNAAQSVSAVRALIVYTVEMSCIFVVSTLGWLPFDLFGFNLSHLPGRGIVASAPLESVRRTTLAERKRLHQRTSHIRAGLRMREQLNGASVQGLVDGTWSMVEASDTDGKRFIVARKNPPFAPDPRGLTPRERQVCTLVATHATTRDIAYELSLKTSTVSTLLHRAMRKLGTESRIKLAERMVPAWRDERGAVSLSLEARVTEK
jgi:DNA-binding CsgD family transcriptional regulator